MADRRRCRLTATARSATAPQHLGTRRHEEDRARDLDDRVCRRGGCRHGSQAQHGQHTPNGQPRNHTHRACAVAVQVPANAKRVTTATFDPATTSTAPARLSPQTYEAHTPSSVTESAGPPGQCVLDVFQVGAGVQKGRVDDRVSVPARTDVGRSPEDRRPIQGWACGVGRSSCCCTRLSRSCGVKASVGSRRSQRRDLQRCQIRRTTRTA